MRTAARTAMLMAIFILLSKCFGFVREMVMANYFGTTYVTDAYVMAMAIPSIIFAGVLGAVATAYMPIYSKIAESQGKSASNKFTGQVLNILLIVSIFSAIVGMIFSDQIVAVFSSGFTGETAALCSFFLKVTFSYMIFTSTTGILEAFLQYKGVFLAQIIAGYAMNIAIILVIVVSGIFNHYYLAFGWLLGYIIRFIVVAMLARRKGYAYTLNIKIDDNIKSIVGLSLPVFIGSSISQINIFVDKTLASGLLEGSVSALNYANILISVITGLTVSILTTILYPKLAQANSTFDQDRFSNIISTGINIIAIIVIPCSLGAMVYSRQVVQIIYERGAFDPVATAMTSSAFFYYAMGLIFMAVSELMIRACYSIHDMKIPVICGGFSVLINIGLNLLLVRYMAHNGLALATSIAALGNTIFLLVGMKRKHSDIDAFMSKKKLAKITFAALIAIGTSYAFYLFVIVSLSHLIVARVAQLALAVIVGVVIYFILLYGMKIKEIELLKQIVKG